jgi:urease accessory protein
MIDSLYQAKSNSAKARFMMSCLFSSELAPQNTRSRRALYLSKTRAHTARSWAGTAALLLLLPSISWAHMGADAGLHHGFVAGFLHPLTGADHLAAMVAVGLWSALVAERAWPDLLWAPLGFAGMLLVGALAGFAGVQLPAVEPMIAASVLVLGLLVATRWRMSGMAAAALVGTFAVFHGVAHGREFAGGADAGATLAGMLVATVFLHMAGIGFGLTLCRGNAWLPRLAGGCVALLGAPLLTGVA